MTDPPTPTLEGQRPAASIGVIAATAAAWVLGMLSYWAQPQLFGALMKDHGLGEEAVGWIFSIENTALALTILAAAGPLARFSRCRVALAGSLLACAANVASSLVGSYEGLLLTRWFVGMGGGLMMAAGTAAAASTRDPERVFAIATVTANLIWALEPSVIPFALVPFGTGGGFLLLAGASLVAIPLFFWLLPPRAAPEVKPSLLAAPNRILALVAMAAMFIYEVGQGGVWIFVAQIGEHVGLNEHATGRVMTLAGLTGLVGGVTAAWLGGRIGRKIPIAIGIGLNGVAAVGLAFTDDPTVYLILMWLWTAAYTFVVPYLMGALTAMDDLGRWVVANDGVWTLGDALAPGLAGLIVERGGYAPLGGMALISGLVCIVVLILVLRSFDTRQGGASAHASADGSRPPDAS